MMRLITATLGLVLASSTHARSGAEDARAYRLLHEKDIVTELAQLIAIPNVADNVADVERNATHLRGMLERRGFDARILAAAPDTPPSVYGELKVRGAKRTLLFYAHYDGQPVAQPQWLAGPFEAVVRDGPPGPTSRTVDWQKAKSPLNPEWRLYGRSASDDKAPIVAILRAIDALQAAGRAPGINIKVFFEGEEERSSPHLARILSEHKSLLRSDALIFCDGPIHPSRRMMVYLGTRGEVGLELTAFGPTRPLHSGHYGNWAPNPAIALTRLIALMRDEEGRILIPGFLDDVRPLTPADRTALDVLPDVETALRNDLNVGRTEGSERLMSAIMRPALNLRGLRANEIGKNATNSIPMTAHASIDFRLVPDQTQQSVRERVERFIRDQGWHVVHEQPTAATLAANAKVIRAQWTAVYEVARLRVDSPLARDVITSIERATSAPVIVIPMMGASVPIAAFVEALGVPTIGVPIVNHDNNQHGANENIRLQNLWDGIEIFAAIIDAAPRWDWAAHDAARGRQ